MKNVFFLLGLNSNFRAVIFLVWSTGPEEWLALLVEILANFFFPFAVVPCRVMSGTSISWSRDSTITSQAVQYYLLRGLLHPNVVWSRWPFKDRQKEFLNKIFEEGGGLFEQGTRWILTMKTMRRARNENNERMFQMSEFLTSQQVASYLAEKK